mmetsp:Transcript_22054/g.39289  ORF Transcript_22054/g.39289 Transcript_22054/m.39289 type:complete len:115 (-) Transcript_22054:240-584(-)|eukprot:CAMPEP_0175082664 /NCGR_PEP_ID=MMETSP0052_2-20121109/26889_1 /TAXON_ID=51329 ORGANISM="Polytomella parva, Strain SAG 63-3" /NCGR_SAMPLE_ID=MMETSP0052_2 /ASSEMBLY_ACC=CAM_ASM_000194 /LENGTH=114 /DNA_ID=CAMNT_0016353901 /DNA_START=88 /DNA_END=432 /DNA_ORIENTATION=+
MSKSASYHRLQEIEKRVIECVDIAGSVTEDLSHLPALHLGSSIAHSINDKCSKYLLLIEEAHKLVQEGAEEARRVGDYDIHAYSEMSQSYVDLEKLDVVSRYLKQLSDVVNIRV